MTAVTRVLAVAAMVLAPAVGSAWAQAYRYQPPAGPDTTVKALAFPTGNVSDSAIVVHQVMPRAILRGATFDYQYHVTNTSSAELASVVLRADRFDNLTVLSADPAGDQDSGAMVWNLGTLGPRETKVIKLNARSDAVGEASACITATYANTLCAPFKVVEPLLEVTKTATPQALLCDEIQITYRVSNPGSGVARNVRIQDDLTEGLVIRDGRTAVVGSARDLAPGQSKQVTVYAKASHTGVFASGATATADGGLTATSEVTSTTITQPILQITSNCPGKRFLGRNADFEFTVTNTGDADAADTVLTNTFAGAGRLVSVSDTGRVAGSQVSWNLGTLKPGQSRTVSARTTADVATELHASATVQAGCADSVNTTCVTPFVGIPAILLEVIDLDDPVEVGSNTTYVISVTNQGTAPDSNILITCDLPVQESFVSASGATPAVAQGNRVTFEPVATLAPKQKVQWRLVVRSQSEGDSRFAVSLTSTQLTEPVRETESTNHYE